MKNNNRGAVPVIVLYLLGAALLSQAVPNFRLTNLFKKGPPTAELVAAQKKADDAEARAVAAQAKLNALVLDAEAKKDNQIVYSHEMVQGALESNGHAPDSTEKAITDSFLQRADIGLNVAVGKLDPALRAEVIGIVAQLRSGDQEKIRAAQAMLAEKDRELTQATADRVKLEGEVNGVKTELATAVKETAQIKEVVAKKQAEVITYADKARAQEKEAGSLGNLVRKLAWGLGILALLYIVANWVLPSLAQEFPNAAKLQKLNQAVKSVTSAHL